MRRSISLLAMALALAGMPAATAGPTPGGMASDNVEWLGYVPFDAGSAIGARKVDDYLYVTSAKNVTIYDVSVPESPTLSGIAPTGYDNPGGPLAFENEDVDTNGKILLFSQGFVAGGPLVIFDVEDKTSPREISRIEGFSNHTVTCVMDCKYAYGSEGPIVDLRDPSQPKVVGDWGGNGHDLTEVAPGLVLCSCGGSGLTYLDGRKNILKPKVVAQSPPLGNGEYIHSNEWGQKGKDRFVVSTAETWVPAVDSRCTENSGGITTWDASKWKKTHTFTEIDTVRPTAGTVVDGSLPVDALGCSAHWANIHPKFRNGGFVTAGYYQHGTRFFEIDRKGKIAEVGWFLPAGGATWAAYWISNEVVYSIDFTRGMDILRFNADA